MAKLKLCSRCGWKTRDFVRTRRDDGTYDYTCRVACEPAQATLPFMSEPPRDAPGAPPKGGCG